MEPDVSDDNIEEVIGGDNKKKATGSKKRPASTKNGDNDHGASERPPKSKRAVPL